MDMFGGRGRSMGGKNLEGKLRVQGLPERGGKGIGGGKSAPCTSISTPLMVREGGSALDPSGGTLRPRSARAQDNVRHPLSRMHLQNQSEVLSKGRTGVSQ